MNPNDHALALELPKLLSRHARARMQQRAIGPDLVNAALEYGRVIYNKDGTRKHILNQQCVDRHARRIPDVVQQAADAKQKPVYVLCDARTGHVITTGYCQQPQRPARTRRLRGRGKAWTARAALARQLVSAH